MPGFENATLLSEAQYSQLISLHETKLFQSVGVHSESILETSTAAAEGDAYLQNLSEAEDESEASVDEVVLLQKTPSYVRDHASKEAILETMQKKQKEPEITLKDIIRDMEENKKYRAYTVNEWPAFFKAARVIVE